MKLDELRAQIDAMNRQLVELIGKRTEVARQIARIKKKEKLPILDTEREEGIKEEMRQLARQNALSATVIADMFDLLLGYTRLEMEIEVMK